MSAEKSSLVNFLCANVALGSDKLIIRILERAALGERNEKEI